MELASASGIIIGIPLTSIIIETGLWAQIRSVIAKGFNVGSTAETLSSTDQVGTAGFSADTISASFCVKCEAVLKDVTEIVFSIVGEIEAALKVLQKDGEMSKKRN